MFSPSFISILVGAPMIVAIADQACVRQIIRLRWATMLFANDVVHLAACQQELFGNQTIFAAASGPLAHTPSELLADPFSHVLPRGLLPWLKEPNVRA